MAESIIMTSVLIHSLGIAVIIVMVISVLQDDRLSFVWIFAVGASSIALYGLNYSDRAFVIALTALLIGGLAALMFKGL
jgi:hypothetical protein